MEGEAYFNAKVAAASALAELKRVCEDEDLDFVSELNDIAEDEDLEIIVSEE